MQLAIDAADDVPGIALAVDGVVGLMLSWSTERNHSVELLPNIDRLLHEAGRTKSDLDAFFVDIGPGGYAALRVGVSMAKGLAHGLGVPLVGVGRLALDAFGVCQPRSRIVAVHRAGRGELAIAMYREDAGEWLEVSPPHLIRREDMRGALQAGDLLTGDVDEQLAEIAQQAGASVVSATEHRVVALAARGAARLTAGLTDDPRALVPLYLRAPAIGPQGG